jgi:hypothetical protein
MSLFIEVDDVEKGCQVIINLDEVMEIAPKVRRENGVLVDDGCDLFFPDSASVGGKRAMKVANSYSLFKQLVMQMVSADDIARVHEKAAKVAGKKEPAPVPELNIPTFKK